MMTLEDVRRELTNAEKHSSLFDMECQVRRIANDDCRLADLEDRIERWLNNVGRIGEVCPHHIAAARLLLAFVRLMLAGKVTIE